MLVDGLMAAGEDRQDSWSTTTAVGGGEAGSGCVRVHTDLWPSLPLCALCPCRVCPRGTRACPPRWPRRTPRPETHTQTPENRVPAGASADPERVSFTHVGADGVLQRPEPLGHHAVVLRLDEELGALPGLQLHQEPPGSETALQASATRPSGTHLDDVLLAGLVLGRPLHKAPPQVHGELGFGLAASELERRSRNQVVIGERRVLIPDRS